jgi:recombinational DNA repair protein (RecF pathway)
MSHQLYTTEAIVCGSRAYREADRFYFLLTPGFGLAVARATGVRKQGSKLAGHLTDLGLVRATIVRGRDYWRLTGVEQQTEFFAPLAQAGRLGPIRHIMPLLRRLMPGERPDEALFIDLKNFLEFLAVTELSPVEIKDAESLMVLRLLAHLGYLKAEKSLQPFVEFSDWQREQLAELAKVRALVIRTINLSFEHTHL